MSYFLVPRGAGAAVEETWDALGMRATANHDLHLDHVVPGKALLTGVEGLVLPPAQLMSQWLVASYAAVDVGLARAAVDVLVEAVGDRPLGDLPAVRARLGRADAAAGAAELVVREVARKVDAEPDAESTRRWVYRAKLIAGETAGSVAASMLEAAGASALRRGCARADLPRRALRIAAAGDLGRLRRLAGGGEARS